MSYVENVQPLVDELGCGSPLQLMAADELLSQAELLDGFFVEIGRLREIEQEWLIRTAGLDPKELWPVITAAWRKAYLPDGYDPLIPLIDQMKQS